MVDARTSHKVSNPFFVMLFHKQGTRSTDGVVKPAKRGVGKLVAAASKLSATPPLVVPMVHLGMEEIMPKGAKVNLLCTLDCHI